MINFLKENPDEYEFYFESDHDRQKYMERMLKSGIWGGELEMAVLS